ncbi:hypothetical protein EHI8A_058820 [Entamoeba histolytica HM-1:IMSS-B]|uniref:LIM zinc-binding domain-containing protein n=8 Tax=Entamoeba TaxID=5758 RepID=C4M7N2_ENTH1|nr:hypothetical protein ENU1_108730 [Entamoeba nuttalli P19]XP_648989.1 hypothetical protein EHI_037160 [Entamoeba histolytica HM-1:IMSS]EMD47765.1 Hypothetical protein EHI5A_090830 [Entamoeba histolytica KU27]EMH73272.1 hypothetical protein EHI8A_058820 [Entamoeba histolytica HM-1:IMSS-B]EMS17156.1 hypothetical protein KM1_111120 [Entamoeba histolytica HM-3:IMSS]ENY65184.1 hypothetical protein EHI7A_057430 [Entamoeba histolytica HM-1:IMSS-A]GAT97556.1 hypothetical protein CL6EHI_037160 [Enta|eukprot:XP_008857720.1 hypothetical protein ENU1_108730 [Entamoeba nuttalli P19]
MPKCFLCGKEVYPAEKVNNDGKIFHNVCFQTYRKQQQIEYKHTKQAEYYKKADVVPAYYRVADKESGEPSRMTAGVDDEAERQRIIDEENKFLQKVAEQNTNKNVAQTTVCECGQLVDNKMNFCPYCGKPMKK